MSRRFKFDYCNVIAAGLLLINIAPQDILRGIFMPNDAASIIYAMSTDYWTHRLVELG